MVIETGSDDSLGELNALIKKKKSVNSGKENKAFTAGGFSRATKSTAAMSHAGGLESFNRVANNPSTVRGNQGHQSSIDGDEFYHMKNLDSGFGTTNVLNYPYMCDQLPPATLGGMDSEL